MLRFDFEDQDLEILVYSISNNNKVDRKIKDIQFYYEESNRLVVCKAYVLKF